ncbi:formylglycine-generating enzyme family protein, partial [Leptolyngbyaceae cyanobacterium CCMR0081]|nr:formylglycine-generating enzyme family protein [Adonisia turfae CCMR0081]
YDGAPSDGSAWKMGDSRRSSFHIMRGGSWGSYPVNCRSAYRNLHPPENRNDSIGFRVVSVPPGSLS